MFSVHNVKNAETLSFRSHSRTLALSHSLPFAKYNCFMEKLLRYIFYAPDSDAIHSILRTLAIMHMYWMREKGACICIVFLYKLKTRIHYVWWQKRTVLWKQVQTYTHTYVYTHILMNAHFFVAFLKSFLLYGFIFPRRNLFSFFFIWFSLHFW